MRFVSDKQRKAVMARLREQGVYKDYKKIRRKLHLAPKDIKVYKKETNKRRKQINELLEKGRKKIEAGKLELDFKRELNTKHFGTKYNTTWETIESKSGGTTYMLSPPDKDKKGNYKYPDYFIEMHPHDISKKDDPQCRTWHVTVSKKSSDPRIGLRIPQITIAYKQEMTKIEAQKFVLTHLTAINRGLE